MQVLRLRAFVGAFLTGLWCFFIGGLVPSEDIFLPPSLALGFPTSRGSHGSALGWGWLVNITTIGFGFGLALRPRA